MLGMVEENKCNPMSKDDFYFEDIFEQKGEGYES
jgi:hypothetical protein